MKSAYQRGDSVSTYSLERGAVADDVKYTPRMSNAWWNYQDMRNSNKTRKGAPPFVQEIDLEQGQGSWLQGLQRLAGQKLNQYNKKTPTFVPFREFNCFFDWFRDWNPVRTSCL